jgi:2-hydroxyisobutanoyl-CoA mutase large subunit
MARLAETAKSETQNILPITIEAVENGATMGEIIEALKQVWGTYRETPVF